MKPSLFFGVASVEARKLMSYRGDFWLSAVAAFVVEIAVAYYLWAAIFRESGREVIGGFTQTGITLYYVLAILFGKLIRGEDRQSTIAQNIYDGSLSRYLLFPANYFAFKYAEHLGTLVAALVQLVLFGGAAVLLLDLSAAGEVSAASVARTLVAIAAGNLLAFLLAFLLEAVAFWADNVWSLLVLLRFLGHLLGGQLLPLHLFPAWAQPLLDLLPFRFLYYFPTMTLLNRLDTATWASGMAVALAWCVVLGLAARVVWRRGCLQYTGVGI